MKESRKILCQDFNINWKYPTSQIRYRPVIRRLSSTEMKIKHYHYLICKYELNYCVLNISKISEANPPVTLKSPTFL